MFTKFTEDLRSLSYHPRFAWVSRAQANGLLAPDRVTSSEAEIFPLHFDTVEALAGAYAASERFLFLETDAFIFLEVTAGVASFVPEATVSSCSWPFLGRVARCLL